MEAQSGSGCDLPQWRELEFDPEIEVESGKRQASAFVALWLYAVCTAQRSSLPNWIGSLETSTSVSGLMESKVDFVAVDFPQANKLTVHILAAVAEHEASMISAAY